MEKGIAAADVCVKKELMPEPQPLSNLVLSGLEELDNYETKILAAAKDMLENQAQFPVDIFAVGILNRSLSLLYGFTTLIRAHNFIGAAHLVRMHLDNYMRLFAVWQVEDPHDFALKVIEGKSIKSLKDSHGNLMRDLYLKEKIAEDHPWMKDIYNTTNAFVHFGRKHILTSQRVTDKETGIVETQISKYDKYVPDESRIEAISATKSITDCIIELVEGWTWSKKNPESITELRSNGDFNKNEDHT